MNVPALIAHAIWFIYTGIKSLSWKRATNTVEKVQRSVLRRLIATNVDSAFGRDHNFETIDSIAAFQQQVPLCTYDDMLPYVNRIAQGETRVLTAEQVRHFGVTSGSASASKLIPYTQRLIQEFQEGINPWIFFLIRNNPGIIHGKSYWSVTPVGHGDRRSLAGIPIGFDDESSYFGGTVHRLLRCIMVTPPELALVQDIDAFRYATLRFLIQEKSLTWVSIWNPTFVTLFLKPLEQYFDQLIEDVRTGSLSIDLGVKPDIDRRIRRYLKKSPRRARELTDIRTQQQPFRYESIWPRLQLISCWTHGNASEAVQELRRYFPTVTIQPKGLIATEAFVSFPFLGEASALALNSHFFEFQESESGSLSLAHQLQLGKIYNVIVSTGGGLYRYQLNDLIEVIGFKNQCPLMKFVGRSDRTIDIRGEKLNERFVHATVSEALSELSIGASFWMLAPERLDSGKIAYTLFLEPAGTTNPEMFIGLAERIDQKLRKSYHFEYCRRLGQLEACKLFIVQTEPSASQVYLLTCTELGQRLGDIKPVALHGFDRWSTKFRGGFLT